MGLPLVPRPRRPINSDSRELLRVPPTWSTGRGLHRSPARRMNSLRTLLPVSSAVLCIAGCAVGPDYRPPDTSAPTAWTSIDPQARPALSTDSAGDLASWWTSLEDPLLGELVDTALRANPDVASAQARLRQVRAQRTVEASGLYPSLGASADGRRANASVESSGRNATADAYDAGLDASWELDVFGGVRRGVEAARPTSRRGRLAGRDTGLAGRRGGDELRRRARAAGATRASRATTWKPVRDTAAHRVARRRLGSSAARTSSRRAATANRRAHRSRASRPASPWPSTPRRAARPQMPGSLHARLDPEPEPSGGARRRSPSASRPTRCASGRTCGSPSAQLAAATARVGEAKAAMYPSFRLSGSIGVEALTASALGDGGARSRRSSAASPHRSSKAAGCAARSTSQDALREQAEVAYQQTLLVALQDVENALVDLAHNRERSEALSNAAANRRALPTSWPQGRYGGRPDRLPDRARHRPHRAHGRGQSRAPRARTACSRSSACTSRSAEAGRPPRTSSPPAKGSHEFRSTTRDSQAGNLRQLLDTQPAGRFADRRLAGVCWSWSSRHWWRSCCCVPSGSERARLPHRSRRPSATLVRDRLRHRQPAADQRGRRRQRAVRHRRDKCSSTTTTA